MIKRLENNVKNTQGFEKISSAITWQSINGGYKRQVMIISNDYLVHIHLKSNTILLKETGNSSKKNLLYKADTYWI